MEGLSLDNMMTEEEAAALFESENKQEENEETTSNNSEESKEEKKETTEVVDVNNLFTEKPESVGSGDNNEGIEDTDPKKDGTSPKFFSSIAKAFAEEGIFPDLDDDAIERVNSPEDFRELIEQRIKSELDDRQKRIDEALNYGVEPSVIKQYENTIAYLDSIDTRKISDEGE